MSAATKTPVVRKRDGRIVDFEPARVATAIEKAFRAEMNLADGQPFDSEILQDIASIAEQVAEIVTARGPDEPATVEQIQDVVEISLMRREHFHVARRYILYRTEHARMRAIRGQVGYKLPQLLDLRTRRPTAARETLFGDDSEGDDRRDQGQGDETECTHQRPAPVTLRRTKPNAPATIRSWASTTNWRQRGVS